MPQREQYLLRAAELSAKAQTESVAADKSEFERSGARLSASCWTSGTQPFCYHLRETA